MIVGSGDFRFEWIAGWGEVPYDTSPGDVPAVAVDSQDRLFVFQRGRNPIVVLDRDGHFVTSWGEGRFPHPHGIFIGRDDSVTCVDDHAHTVQTFTPDGRLVLDFDGEDQTATTGYRPGYPRSVKCSAPPFCRPTGAALTPDGAQMVVTDGYGNARLHRFGRDGKLVSSFGEPGEGPAQFVIPHGIHIDPDGRVYVSDRENERVQIFSAQDEFLGEWRGVNCPNNVTRGPDGHYYVAELGRVMQGIDGGKFIVRDAIRARITVRAADGRILSEWGAPDPLGDGLFFAPHGIAIDSRGDIYVGEVPAAYGGGLAGPGRATLHKFVRTRR